MALYYLDASALVKYYVLEPGSTWVRGLVDNPANTISIADASIAESAAAFAILFRTQRISQRTQEAAFHAMMRHIASHLLKTMPLRTVDFQLAAHLTQRYLLKAYDAVQLAVALRYSQFSAAHGLVIAFVSGDNALIKAAKAEGLLTDNPFEHVLPQDTPRSRA
jgi:predicted nucleic acid-binding protein